MLLNVISISGVVLLLGSYIFSQATFLNEKIKQSISKWALHYSLANFLGAAMLTFYAIVLKNPIFIIVEGTWCAVGLVAVLQILRGNKLLSRKV